MMMMTMTMTMLMMTVMTMTAMVTMLSPEKALTRPSTEPTHTTGSGVLIPLAQ
jgi:hypothetical protein